MNSLNGEVDSLISSGDYEGAVEVFEQGIKSLKRNGYIEDENSEDTKTQLDYAVDDAIQVHASEYASLAEEFFNDDDIDSAVCCIKIALELDCENDTYKEKYDKYLG